MMQGLCQSGHVPVLPKDYSCQRHAYLITSRSKKSYSHRCGHVHEHVVDKRDSPRRICVRCGAAGSDRPSLDQSPGLMEGIQEQKEHTKWATATVTQNRHYHLCSLKRLLSTNGLSGDLLCRNVSADGCMRSLTLSIEDPVRAGFDDPDNFNCMRLP